MIHAVSGIIKTTFPQQVLIELGPLTCALQVPDGTIYTVGSAASLAVYIHWNAEHGPSFYGFATGLDKALFILIISCSGIGPKIALAALGQLGSSAVIESIDSNNVRLLSSVNGIGAKKAEQIILHLKHKIPALITEYQSQMGDLPSSHTAEQWHTIQLALESLDYSRPEITQALHHLKAQNTQNISFDQLLRKALAFLAVRQ